jgi:large subunit ribosomal protein L17
MRHRVVRSKLASDKDHNKSLLNNLSTELVLKEKIETTLARAKFLRPHIEKLITFAGKAAKTSDKLKKFNAVKELNRNFHVGEATKKMLEDIAKRFIGTPGGYTRIVKIGFRDGDQAEMARIEFTKAPEKKASKAGKALSRLKKNTKENKVDVQEKAETNE